MLALEGDLGVVTQKVATHEVLNNHHLALYYLSKGITTLIPLMRKYRQAVTNYRLMIKGFLDGLDKLSTGWLCYEVLDPIMLSKYLKHMSFSAYISILC